MKSHKLSVQRMLALLVGICIVLLFIQRLWHHPQRPYPSPREKTETSVPSPASREPPGRIHTLGRTAAKDSAVRFGILGPPTGAAEWCHPLSVALKCVEEYGSPVEVAAPPGTDPASLRTLLQGEDINAGTCSLDTALNRSSVLLIVLDEEVDDAAILKLKAYVAAGGWLVVVNNPPLTRRIAALPGGSSGKLNSTMNYALQTEISSARFLVRHPILPHFQSRDWFPIPTVEGEVEVTKPATGLWLVAFRNPSCPGLRVISVGKGGIVDINWRVCKPSKLNEIESRKVLRNAVSWLADKRFWTPPARIPPQQVTGKVVDKEGLPIGEVGVTARVFADWGQQIREITSETDDEGNFSLIATAPSIYWFEASAEGLSQENPFVMAPCEEGREQQPVTIVMRRTVELFGTVYYEGREEAPAPDFPVTLVPTDRDPEIEHQTTVSDQQGQFAFERVPYGKTYLVSSQKGEWGGWKMVELPLDPKQEPERISLAIERVPLVYGQVVEHDTQRAIAGASVRVGPGRATTRDPDLSPFAGSLTRIETSGEEQGFAFHLLPGVWQLRGMAEDHIGAAGIRDGKQANLDRLELKVWPAQTEPECPLVLELARHESERWRTQFYGMVYLPSGDPAPDAFICPLYGHPTRADSDGQYETQPVSCIGRRRLGGVLHYQFWFEVRCLSHIASTSILLPECPERCHKDFWLEEGKPAKGYVRDIHGNPVEGAKVTMLPLDDRFAAQTLAMSSSTVTASDGSFTLLAVTSPSDPRRDLSAWGVGLRAEKLMETEQGAVKYVGTVAVTVPEGAPIEDFDIIITRTGQVGGTVTRHDGNPLRNERGRVTLRYRQGGENGYLGGSSVYLDERGGFRLEVPGFHQRIDLPARERGDANWRHPAAPPPETSNLYVEIWGRFEGSTAIAPKSCFVEGVKPGMTDLEIRLPPVGAIRARAVDGETGLAVESANVHALPNMTYDVWPPDSFWTGRIDLSTPIPRGQFNLVDLIPCQSGTYRVGIFSDDYLALWLYEVPVTGNQTTDLGDILLYSRWWIRGRVVAADSGKPVAAAVSIRGVVSTTTDEDGRFSLALDTKTGWCSVNVTPANRDWQERQIGPYHRRGRPLLELGDIRLEPAEPE